MAARKAISKRTRFEIFKRDEFKCRYCGARGDASELHVDHVMPVSLGGTNDPLNLITACIPCNQGKSDVLLSSVPEPVKKTAKKIKKNESVAREVAQIAIERDERIEDLSWHVANILIEEFRTDGIRRQWLSSIRLFVSKLGFDEVLDAMRIAISRYSYNERKCFLYFCGICWNRIKEN